VTTVILLVIAAILAVLYFGRRRARLKREGKKDL
jgi:hypothetical protein